MLGHLFDCVPDIPEFLKHINQTATTVLESPMTLAHHSNVTLVPFCLCPSFLYSYLLYFLFSCSASSCWQPFLFISLPPSLFLNPALVPAPLVCSLPSLPGIPARYFLLSISLASWKKPRKQRHLLLYFARKFHFPSLVCCRGQRCGVN